MLVNIEKVKSGSYIKSELKDNTGKVVFKAGTKTTPLLLKRLVSWGIKSVDIEGEDTTSIDANEAQSLKRQEKKPSVNFDKELVRLISKRFSNVRDDELMNGIMRLAIKHLSEHQLKKINLDY